MVGVRFIVLHALSDTISHADDTQAIAIYEAGGSAAFMAIPADQANSDTRGSRRKGSTLRIPTSMNTSRVPCKGGRCGSRG